MSLDRAINILVTIALVEMMVRVGLRVTFADLASTAKNWRLVARATVANYVLVPAVTVILLMLFHVGAMVARGLYRSRGVSGAPYSPPLVEIARANVSLAVGLMAILAGTSTMISPALLHVLLPWVSGAAAPQMDLVGMLGALLATQLLPLLLGLTVKHRQPQLANRLLAPLELVTKVLNLSIAGLILSTQFRMLAEIPVAGFAGMLILLVASLAIGWLAGGPGRNDRRTMTLTTRSETSGSAWSS